MLHLTGLCAQPTANTSPLQVYTNEYPPFCFTENDQVTGVATDLVVALMAKMGQSPHIQALPWARALESISGPPNVMLYTVTRTEERERQFKWVGPLMSSHVVLFARRDAKLVIQRLDDAKAVKAIGTVQGYATQTLLRDKGFTNLDALAGSEGGNPEKLMTGRIDLWATDNVTGIYQAKLRGVDPAMMKVVYRVVELPKYLAFSKQTDDQVIKQWQTALDKAKKDGTFHKILAQWGIDDK